MLEALKMWVLVAKRRRVNLLLVRERSRGLLVHEGSRAAPSGPGTDQGCRSGWADGVLSLPVAWTHEEGFPLETGIPGFRDSAVPVNGRKGEDTVHSSTPRYRAEEPVSVSGSCKGTFRYTAGQRGQVRGRGRGRGPHIGTQGFRGVSTPSHHQLSQQISQLYRVRFCYLAYGQECYLILVHRIHLSLHQL